jgi:hypothetical protein
MERPTLRPGEPVTIGEKYGYAMAITEPAEAASYFEACVDHSESFHPSREEAERINIGYYAGYYDAATRERVERLFSCAHPVFGAIAQRGAPTEAEALLSGVIRARMG